MLKIIAKTTPNWCCIEFGCEWWFYQDSNKHYQWTYFYPNLEKLLFVLDCKNWEMGRMFLSTKSFSFKSINLRYGLSEKLSIKELNLWRVRPIFFKIRLSLFIISNQSNQGSTWSIKFRLYNDRYDKLVKLSLRISNVSFIPSSKKQFSNGV